MVCIDCKKDKEKTDYYPSYIKKCFRVCRKCAVVRKNKWAASHRDTERDIRVGKMPVPPKEGLQS